MSAVVHAMEEGKGTDVKGSYGIQAGSLIEGRGFTGGINVGSGTCPHEQPRPGTLTPDRGSCAWRPADYRTANPYTVLERNTSPGRRTVLGNAGRLGESGKCWVSSAMPSPGVKGSPMWSAV